MLQSARASRRRRRPRPRTAPLRANSSSSRCDFARVPSRLCSTDWRSAPSSSGSGSVRANSVRATVASVGSSESTNAARSKPAGCRVGIAFAQLARRGRRRTVSRLRAGRRPARAGTGAAAAGAAEPTSTGSSVRATAAGSSASGLAMTASRLILVPTWASAVSRPPSAGHLRRGRAAPPAAPALRRRCAGRAAAQVAVTLRWGW